MAVHVLYLTVVIAVPVCMDLQVRDVKVRLFSTALCHILQSDYQPFSITYVRSCVFFSIIIIMKKIKIIITLIIIIIVLYGMNMIEYVHIFR